MTGEEKNIDVDVICMIRKPYLKRIKQLEKEISVLLSCKNCPENKGGYICEKEYNDKCLAQKIQYIKELKEEIEKMKDNQKTAYVKGIRHFAKAIKDYDRKEGAWTDYLENTVDEVLKRELSE